MKSIGKLTTSSLLVFLLVLGCAQQPDPPQATSTEIAQLASPESLETDVPEAISPSTVTTLETTPAETPTQPVIPSAVPTAEPIPTDTLQPTFTLPPSPTHTQPPPTSTTAPLPTETAGPFMRGEVIGSSSGGFPLEAFHLGYGESHIVVIGGIHGGYEWNTIMLSYELIDYFGLNPDLIPSNIMLTIIPSANPDGQVTVTGQAGRFAYSQVSSDTRPGRFNANGVDLNRNWGCNWQADTFWGDRFVSGGGGSSPYSERESWVLREFIFDRSPELVIFLHSAAPGIFPGRCNGVQVPDTLRHSETYGAGSGYVVRTEGFNFYTITGESSDTLNLFGIPAFTVELNNHQDTDFLQNLGGLLAVMDTPLVSVDLELER